MFHIEYDIIEEISIGPKDNPGTRLRLAENTRSKKRQIQIYSSMTKDWHAFYRYDVDNVWKKWKKLCQRIRSKT